MTRPVLIWEAEPIKELTDITAYGEEGIYDDYDSEQDEEEDDEIHETDLAALLGNSGEDPEAEDALAEALQLDAVAMVAWQRMLCSTPFPPVSGFQGETCLTVVGMRHHQV